MSESESQALTLTSLISSQSNVTNDQRRQNLGYLKKLLENKTFEKYTGAIKDGIQRLEKEIAESD